MKYGVRNRIRAKVKSVRKGDVISLVKFTVTDPHEMASVLTTESVDHLKVIDVMLLPPLIEMLYFTLVTISDIMHLFSFPN